MALQDVRYAYAEEMTPKTRAELGIKEEKGLVAIETHASDIQRKGVSLKKGFLPYLWDLEKKSSQEKKE